MNSYALPTLRTIPAAPPKTAYLIASGDLRESANVAGWPTQVALEAAVGEVFANLGWTIVRANPIDPATGHGFISSQRMGMDDFATIAFRSQPLRPTPQGRHRRRDVCESFGLLAHLALDSERCLTP